MSTASVISMKCEKHYVKYTAMKCNEGKYRELTLRFALTVLIVAITQGQGAVSETTVPNGGVVRSGCEIDYPPFCFVHEDGRADGFSVELMRAALQKMGREVTFRTGPWAEVRGWLEQGEVDTLPLVGRTPEREEFFDFTVPYLTMHGAIVLREDTEGVHSLADLRGRRVGVMQGDNAEEFLRRAERDFEIVTAPTFTDSFRDLAEGRCDAVVIQRLVAIRLLEETGMTNLKIVDRPIREFSQDFCFAVKDGDREMLSVLNEGLALLMADGTHRRLHAKWFAQLELPSNRPIVVGGDYNFPPMEFLDKNDRPAGFSVEVTRAIAREMNLNVRIELGPWEEIVAGLENGNIDVVQGMFYTPERDRVLDFSPHYLTSHYVGVSGADDGRPPETLAEFNGRTVAVQTGDAPVEALAKAAPDALLVMVDTHEDMLRAVVEGRADCGIALRFTALHFIEKNAWSGLRLGKRSVFTGEYCYAVAQGNEALLAQFIEGLRVLQHTDELRRIHEKWLGVYDPGIPTQTVLKYSVLIVGPILIIALLSLVWSWLLRRQVAARTRELQESLGRFQAVFEAANVGKAITLPTGEVNVNKAFADMLGYAPEELRGKTWQELTLPEDVSESERRIAPLLDGRENATRFEKRYLCKDGGTVWADVSVTLLRDARGRPLHFITTVVDISERKRAGEAIQASESRYRRLFESAKDGILILDAETGKVVDVNPYLLKLLGYDRNWLLGKPLWEIGPFRDVAASREAFGVLQEKAYVRYEHLPLETATGGLVDVEFVSNIYLVNQVKVIQCNIRDITERRRAEKGLARQLRYEHAVAAASTCLLSPKTSGMVVRDALAPLLEASGVSRVYIFENFEDPADGLCTRQTYEACAPGVPPEIDNSLLQYKVYSQGIERWRQVLSAGGAIRGDIADLPDNEREALEPQGIISILVLPLVVDGRWWGFIGFDETRQPRKWHDSEVVLLRTAADMFGAYFTRKHAVEHLTLLGQMLDDAPASITIHDAAGHFIYVNVATVSLHGYESVDEFLEINLHELDVPESGALLAERFRKIAEEGEARFEVEHYRKDGSTFPLTVVAKRIGWEGRPAVLSIAADITERKRAESLIKHLNRVLRAIREVNHLITHETDRAALLRQSCEILVSTRGYRSAWGALVDAEGNLEAVAECGIAENFSAVRDALKQGEWPECYLRALEHPDGIAPVQETSVNCKACTLKDTYRDTAALAGRLRHAGRDYGVLVVALPAGLADEEEEQRLFRELVGDVAYALHAMETAQQHLEGEARFRTYIEHAPYGIFIVDRSGHYLDVNPTAGEITGHTPNEMLTMSIGDILPPKSRESSLALFQRLINEGRISEQMPFIHKSGEIRHWMVSAVALSAERFLVFVEDITRRRHHEAEREKLQAQLIQAQKMESVGRLAGGVAHDFNNILQAMMGYSQILLDSLPGESEDRECAAEIYTGVERAAALTRQLLAFARKQTIAPKVLDLNETIESMLKMLRRLIGEDIDLAWQPRGNLWAVKVDPGQIDQMLANLCVNARDAIAGVGKVTVETKNVTFDEAYCADHNGFIPGEFVLLAVSDDGCGMDHETLENIFEPFFTTKEVNQGTGLGLATIYGIVKQNEGFINVYSEPGVGTTFKIYLPRYAVGVAREEEQALPETFKGHGETVLFVEDDASILRLGEQMLGNMGYDVHAFSAAREALEFARTKEGVQLLITDVVMPELSGRDLADAVHHIRPEVRVLFMSGYTANVIAHRGVLDEGVNFIQKPFASHELAKKVREVLEG